LHEIFGRIGNERIGEIKIVAEIRSTPAGNARPSLARGTIDGRAKVDAEPKFKGVAASPDANVCAQGKEEGAALRDARSTVPFSAAGRKDRAPMVHFNACDSTTERGTEALTLLDTKQHTP